MALFLTEDMRAVVAGQRLCFAATVTPEGRPNLSPKGTIRVWDDHTLFFLDLASPVTRSNLEHNPWIELNVVDPLSRRGYRFLGMGTLHQDDEVHRDCMARIAADEGVEYEAAAAVLVEVERARPLISPGYGHVADEWAMRALWTDRRGQLEEEFEAHMKRSGVLRGVGRSEWSAGS